MLPQTLMCIDYQAPLTSKEVMRGSSLAGSIEASTVVFASAILSLPRSRPRQRARAAEVRGPGQMREGAVAPSPILGGRGE